MNPILKSSSAVASEEVHEASGEVQEASEEVQEVSEEVQEASEEVQEASEEVQEASEDLLWVREVDRLANEVHTGGRVVLEKAER